MSAQSKNGDTIAAGFENLIHRQSQHTRRARPVFLNISHAFVGLLMGADDHTPTSAVARAFLRLLATRKNIQAIIAYLEHRLGNFHDAEDVCQSAFEEIAGTSEEMGGVDNPFAYFSTVLKREVARYSRARAKECQHFVLSSEIDPEDMRVGSGGGADPSETVDTLQQLEAAMSELSEKGQLVLGLVMKLGLTYEQAAKYMGISTHDVKKTLQRAREQLRRSSPKAER